MKTNRGRFVTLHAGKKTRATLGLCRLLAFVLELEDWKGASAAIRAMNRGSGHELDQAMRWKAHIAFRFDAMTLSKVSRGLRCVLPSDRPIFAWIDNLGLQMFIGGIRVAFQRFSKSGTDASA